MSAESKAFDQAAVKYVRPVATETAYDTFGKTRPLGGIGRRSGFKIHRPQGHIGSTPIEATLPRVRGEARSP